ncbi:MAG: hypothetical protein AAF434_20420 [Pseudomonadota bacterium]
MKSSVVCIGYQAGASLLGCLLGVLIVCVISAVTLPQIAKSTDDSQHIERVNETANRLQQAITEIHHVWQAEGTNASIRDIPTHGLGQIDTNIFGFPIGIHDNDTLSEAADCTHLWLNILNDPPSAWHNTQTNPDFVAEIENGSCRFRYRRADGISIVYQPKIGQVRVEASRS